MRNNHFLVELEIQKINNEKFFVILVNAFFDRNIDNFEDAFSLMRKNAIQRIINFKGGDEFECKKIKKLNP